jgi:hypothetical protein
MFAAFKERFWLPPRAHGDVIEDRTVGFIELFCDLVYVVVITRAAHHLAEHLTWRGVGEFAVIFGMIWLAWLNGTVYHDLHGREDGRSRAYIFLQMGILAVLAVYTSSAGSDTGEGFAATYAVFLVLLTWMWFTVRRQDAGRWASTTAEYLAGMGASVVIVTVSIFLPDDARVVLWAAFLVGWVTLSFSMRRELGTGDISATESTVERSNPDVALPGAASRSQGQPVNHPSVAGVGATPARIPPRPPTRFRRAPGSLRRSTAPASSPTRCSPHRPYTIIQSVWTV